MKRILSIATLVGLVVWAAPLALAQNPKVKPKGSEEEQVLPGGRLNPKGQPPRTSPKPPSVQRPPVPQPSSKGTPGFPQEDPRTLKPQGKPGQGQQPGPQTEPPRRFNPPQGNQPAGKSFGPGTQPGGNAPKTGRENPRSLGQPDEPKGPPKAGNPAPFTRKPELAPPSRDAGRAGGTQNGKSNGEKAPSFQPGKPLQKAEGGNNEAVHKRPTPMSPSGKPRAVEGDKPKLGDVGAGEPAKGGGAEAARKRPSPMSPSGKPRSLGDENQKIGDVRVTEPARGGSEAARKLPTPTSPPGKPRAFEGEKPKIGDVGVGEPAKGRAEARTLPGRKRSPGESSQTAIAGKKGGGAGGAPAIPAQPAVASTASSDITAVQAPRRMRRLGRTGAEDEGGIDRFQRNPRTLAPANLPGNTSPAVQTFNAPEGGKVYSHGHYHHEYSAPRSSWFVGVGVNSYGSTSLALGYSSGGWGGGPYVGHSAHWGSPWGWGHPHSYWHAPVHCHPVVYHPCYAVPVPVYYSPIYYQAAYVDPWAYNSSSLAFGFSSFGGCAVSSFSFAYSSSNWGIGFGWTSAPAYTVYTPVYDPYVRAIWVDGYYELADERAWVPGTYEEVVSTPVVETILDPLGNTYDAVIEPGSVDYVWRDGYWTVETRRIWHPGHFEYVSAF